MVKAVAKKKRPKRTDKEQHGRFVQAARKLGVNESMEDFTVKFRKIVPPRDGAGEEAAARAVDVVGGGTGKAVSIAVMTLTAIPRVAIASSTVRTTSG